MSGKYAIKMDKHGSPWFYISTKITTDIALNQSNGPYEFDLQLPYG
jgi:hypothetical protein